jgi:hypothetical protein
MALFFNDLYRFHVRVESFGHFGEEPSPQLRRGFFDISLFLETKTRWSTLCHILAIVVNVDFRPV